MVNRPSLPDGPRFRDSELAEPKSLTIYVDTGEDYVAGWLQRQTLGAPYDCHTLDYNLRIALQPARDERVRSPGDQRVLSMVGWRIRTLEDHEVALPPVTSVRFLLMPLAPQRTQVTIECHDAPVWPYVLRLIDAMAKAWPEVASQALAALAPERGYLGAGDAKAPLASASERYDTCFISYGAPDATFAQRLYEDLTAKHVRCYYYPESAVTGRGVWDNIDRGVETNDKVVVICSANSLNRPGVLREIERALQKEDRLQAENARRIAEAEQTGQSPELLDADVLFPIRLDDYVLNEWRHPRKADVVKKHVGDFRGWESDPAKYDKSLRQLFRDLDPKTWPLVEGARP